jgi:hypothetical protein
MDIKKFNLLGHSFGGYDLLPWWIPVLFSNSLDASQIFFFFICFATRQTLEQAHHGITIRHSKERGSHLIAFIFWVCCSDLLNRCQSWLA